VLSEITLSGNPQTTIIPVYAPTNARQHCKNSDEFYEIL